MKRKIYKYLIVALSFVFIMVILIYIIGAIHLNLYNKFKDNYTYKSLPTKMADNSNQLKTYYCEYLDTYERDWYQYEKLTITSDSTFTTLNTATYFRDYFFPVKYYLGLLDMDSTPFLSKYKYVEENVYSIKNGSLIGTLKKNGNKIIFKHDRP